MQINSWNCRGLGNSSKAEAVKDLLKLAPSEILLLQETKIDGEALLLIGKNKWNFNSGKSVSARGSCRELATLWQEENFQLTKCHSTQHWIFTELYHCSSKFTYALFNLYVPVNNLEKKECWLSLSDFLVSKSPANIIIADDLNITLKPNEKKGGIHGKDHM